MSWRVFYHAGEVETTQYTNNTHIHRVWDVSSLRSTCQLSHGAKVKGVAFVPGASLCVSAAEERGVRCVCGCVYACVCAYAVGLYVCVNMRVYVCCMCALRVCVSLCVCFCACALALVFVKCGLYVS